MNSLEIVSLIVSTVVTVAVAITGMPVLKDRIRRRYQIMCLSPRAGELGVLIEPSFEDIEALVFRMSRTMFPAARVPYDSVVLVVENDGDTAQVLWENQIAVLPRRWLRRLKI
jgi:hypothetical protein